MKVDVKNGSVVATAQDKSDIRTLLSLESAPRTYKRRKSMIECADCKREFRGVHGLNIHRALFHRDDPVAA